MVSAAIFGCAGQTLSADERAFFADTDPWGFILFRRNCETVEQTRALCDELRDTVGRHAPILIDHEGGRVSRLSPHIVPKRPAMGLFDLLAQRTDLETAARAARLGGEILARDVLSVGCNVNCVPMVDVRQPDAHDIIGDRALGMTPDQVAVLGRAVADGTLAGGCLPVLKHIPGHGRALSDSHLELPRVSVGREDLDEIDFAPFRALNDLALGMTAHIVYDAIDPDRPATLSPPVLEVIRKDLGFDGLLMTDDLSMKALTGSYRDRAAHSLEAGCDLILHCNGDMDEMRDTANGLSALTSEAERRSDRALKMLINPGVYDVAAAEQEFASLTNGASLS
ncbi:beta-N-acetylhexosaminidase [Parvularcula sp. LCG005]|uniref:beta-N-acetylhexosaminidase n=1 Tax=Parvularcula sp. LCG005 TaxID=3078805 RepID=UPI002942CDD5|nr:beta-N-acetylhexosaminidase [Parvularcula sp. LCG005]WOI52432.1 beta-N-acetylhexosaminidase [Parvularcula sp. LCG005]